MKYGIGIEIGATKQQIAVGSEDGVLRRVITGEVDTSLGAREILRWLDVHIPEAIKELSKLHEKPYGIGVGFGGVVEFESGRILMSVQVREWENILLKNLLEEKYSVPAFIENDTVLGGVGEFLLGAGKGMSDFFYTNIGSGIGGAIFTDGKCLTGQKCGAAYFGQTRIPSWEKAGESMTVENICSGFAIEKRLREPDYIPEDSLLKILPGEINCRKLAQAAKEGDCFAAKEIERVGNSLGIGLSNIISLFHPQRIAIGGGVSHIGEPLFEAIRKSCFANVFAPLSKGTDIVPCRFVQEAVLIGAVLLSCGKWRAEKSMIN